MTTREDPGMTGWSLVGSTLLVRRFSRDSKHEDKACFFEPRTKIAAFDLDSTLISTRSGELYASDEQDWKWWHKSVPMKLAELYDNDYQIIIFTNQGRLTDENRQEAPEAQMWKRKVDVLLNVLDIPLILYAACANDNYRKPRTGMWEKMKEEFHSVELDLSFLVGDAAGRECDHSDADRHFCLNIGIPFFTPEKFFLGAPLEPMSDKFNPAWYLPTHTALATKRNINHGPKHQSLLVFVGAPGAGKTTYYRKTLQPLGYERIGSHQLGLEERVQLAYQVLAEGKSVVIDDTNTTAAARKLWISLASRFKIRVYAIHFTTPADLCLHNDSVRALGGDQTKEEQRKVFPRTRFKDIISRFSEPQNTEGFEEVVKLDFEWHGSSEELRIWNKHWI
ncbi:PNK3P-domain-containing protein [Lindgomyces ingoldianus]|uniref:PNK3P-domain-containing protein n=1 Tax=Lindgomyces ingoldianus TaxID=673940 RepID=A0ACB6QFV7_9PLEO|nr:PNK3P-domain-containing protein [Lindgomyces ingoldianus]KAF2465858.1 PNK3P-domain-containing protein [Lindgomyces ingoldianus]